MLTTAAPAQSEISAEFPEKLQILFQPKRYKVLHGGRGGAKSWGAARALILRSMQEKIRVLCAREFQNSIRDSVHRLLADQIWLLGLGEHFDIQQASIVCKVTGSEFSFEGIRHNVGKIKSYEGVDVCWVEEANKVSKTSWEVLIPTIRKEGSEIWLTFNPELETDETYQRFVLNPPPDSIVVPMSWRDNPWFNDVLRREMEHMKATDYDAYLNVWEGYPRQMLEGAVYANELRAAQSEARICEVPYDRLFPVSTYWDLGKRDMTSIWFAQYVAMQWRIFDFYQNRQKELDHYLKVLQNKGYLYEVSWMPHDADAKRLGMKRTIKQQAIDKGFKVRTVPKLTIANGIAAARSLFPNCYFDRERCSDGLQALRHYRYDVDPDTQLFSKEPLHDENSHAADAFRYFAVSCKAPRQEGFEKLHDAVMERASKVMNFPSSLGWMR